jgi:hypothetical protein
MRNHTKITIESYSIGSPPAPTIAPAIPVHPDQVASSRRLLHCVATAHPSAEISVRASDVINVINALLQETRRADQATARLKTFAASTAQPTPSVN